MVDAGEDPAHAAQREFLEEAMDSEKLDQNELENIMKLVQEMFDNGLMVQNKTKQRP